MTMEKRAREKLLFSHSIYRCRSRNHENVGHDLFGALAKYLQLHPEVLQKEKWLFVPGVGDTCTSTIWYHATGMVH
jgi:hypothetical protein